MVQGVGLRGREGQALKIKRNKEVNVRVRKDLCSSICHSRIEGDQGRG